MKASETIKGLSDFMITRNGRILRINNKYGPNVNSKEVLNSEVLKVEVIKGMFANTTCIRI